MRNPSLLKRPNGKYYIVYWKIENGKYVKKYLTTNTKNKEEANKKFKIFLPPKSEGNILMSQYKERLIAQLEAEFSKSTVSLNKYAFDKLFDIIGDKPLKEYTAGDFEIFRLKLLEKLNKTSANIHIRTLRTIFNKAVDSDYLEVNPMRKTKQFKTEQRKLKYFKDSEVKKILEYIKDRDNNFYNFVNFALYTGCRVSEICALKIENVKMKSKVFEIFEQKTKKTKVIPIHKELMDYMKNLNFDNPEDFVFKNSHGLQYTRDRAGLKLRRVLKSLNIKDRSFHSFRHTYITKLSSLKINPYTMRDLAGHSSIDTTQIYVGRDIDVLRNAVDAVSY